MRLTAQQKIEIAEAIERIAFLPAQPEPKREEVCPNCKELTAYSHQFGMNEDGRYACKPAPSPAPVAGELAWQVRHAITKMHEQKLVDLDAVAEDLEEWARSQATAQPVAYQMPEDLRQWAWRAVEMLRVGQANAEDKDGKDGGRLFRESADELAAAIRNHPRAQAASAQPARDLPKVRNALGLLRSLLTRYASQIDYAKERMGIASAALAELDASAQPWRDLPNVRAYLNKRRIDNGEDMVSPGFEASINKDVRMLRAALAELDAQPKAVGVPPNVRELVSLLLWKIRNNQGSIAIEHYGGLLIEAQKEIDCRPERVEKGE